jgi:hypothetical protein
MANRYAVANGNWSATATWDGGTLPTAADDVYANNFTVTINQAINVLSIRTTSAAGINAGGGFVLDNAYNVTADIRAGGSASNQNCLLINFNSPNSCTITGTLYGSLINNLSDVSAVRHAGTGTVTVNGNIYGGGGGTSASRRVGYRNVSTGSVNINGNIYGNQSGSGAAEHDGVRFEAACTSVIVGNIYAGTQNSCPGLRTNGGTCTITGVIRGDQTTTNFAQGAVFNSTNFTVNGDIESGLGSSGVLATGSSVFNITGNIIGKASGTNQAIGLQTGGTATGTITGTITNSAAGTSNNNQGIYLLGSGTINIYGDIIRVGIGAALRTQNTASTINIFGNVYATGGSGSHIISLEFPGCVLNVTGNVTAPTVGTGNSTGIFISSSATVTVNGNVTGGNINGSQNAGVFLFASSGTVTINGSAIGGNGSQSQGVFMSSGGTAYIRRAIGNGFGVGSVGLVATAGVAGNQGVLIYVEQFEYGARGMSPVVGDCRIQLTANSVVVFRDASLNQITLVNPASVVTPPAVTDVRSGVTYNAGNLTGTCAVPAANSVAAGVAVDNTTGTAVLTQANVWGYALSSASSVAGSVGEKLKKTAIPADIIALG